MGLGAGFDLKLAARQETLLSKVATPLIGLPVAHVWRSYGSALFLEFGQLSPGRARPDGFTGEAQGEMGLMIERSWRIERPRSIFCGSWSEEARWPKAFKALTGAKVRSVEIFGRLPEIAVALSNGMHVASFMTAGGQPDWALFDRRGPETSWLTVRNGLVVTETALNHRRVPRGAEVAAQRPGSRSGR